jgi:hypothetical protein
LLDGDSFLEIVGINCKALLLVKPIECVAVFCLLQGEMGLFEQPLSLKDAG